MSEATPVLTIANTQLVQPAAVVTKKIFLSGLGTSDDAKEDIRQLFSGYGDVVEVVVDGRYATVTFTEERVVQDMEQLGEIMLNSTKLYIGRILEEHKVSPGNDAPFYQAGIKPAPYHQFQPAEHLLSSSYPAYQPQPAYPLGSTQAGTSQHSHLLPVLSTSQLCPTVVKYSHCHSSTSLLHCQGPVQLPRYLQ